MALYRYLVSPGRVAAEEQLRLNNSQEFFLGDRKSVHAVASLERDSVRDSLDFAAPAGSQTCPIHNPQTVLQRNTG